MLETYDLKGFGQKIKHLRTHLGLSQTRVTQLTGINIDTIRKIENGYSLPRYDTLANLSRCYKIDLLMVLSTYQKSNLLFEFYKKLDVLILNGDFNSVRMLYSKLQHEIKNSGDLKLVVHSDLQQLESYINAVSLRYKGQQKLALEHLRNAFRITIPEFEYSNFSQYHYNLFDIRMLVVAAACLGELRNCALSIEISKYILGTFPVDLFSEKSHDLLNIKSLTNIAYNHHRLNQHELALNFAEIGIETSIKKGHMEMLHLLFLRKGVAQFNLSNPDCKNSFALCLSCLKMQNNTAHYNKILSIIKHDFGIDFSRAALVHFFNSIHLKILVY